MLRKFSTDYPDLYEPLRYPGNNKSGYCPHPKSTKLDDPISGYSQVGPPIRFVMLTNFTQSKIR